MNFRMKLLFLTLCYFGNAMGFDFQPQDQKTGLTFIKLSKARISYDSYTMLYHLDISRYRELTTLVENYIKDSLPLCKQLKGKTCEILLLQITSQLNHMKRDELDIEAYQQKSRSKRSIEVVGSFLHWAFGLMDADTAREYDDKINQIQNSSSRFHNLLQEQTILIQEVINLNRKSFEDFQFQLRKLKQFVNQYIYEFYSHLKFVQAEVVFTEGTSLAKLIIMEHQRISQQILRCLEDVVSGKITQLIPKNKLTSDLLEIETHLRENQKLPIDFNIENPLHIFKYSKISASLYGDRLLMEVTIPIVERESYTVYKIIPIPTTINNVTIIINPATNYVLMNDEQKEYIPITPKEFTGGKFNLRGERIIKPAENARIEYSQNCEISIFMNPTKDTIAKFCDIKVIPTSNYFISINSNDMFYAKINKPLIITEYCRGKAAQNHEIIESGLLQLSKECRIVTDKISLRPRANFRFESKDIIVLANSTQNTTFESISERINFIMNISIPQIDDNVLIQDYTTDYNNLFAKAEKIIEISKMNAKWDEIHYSNVNNNKKTYIFVIILILIMVIIMGILIWYFYSKFFKLETWVKLAKVLGRGNTEEIPKLFVHNIEADKSRNIETSEEHESQVEPLTNEYLRSDFIGTP